MNPSTRYGTTYTGGQKTRKDLERQFDKYLVEKRVTLWATWNVNDPVQREEAAKWFVNQSIESGLVWVSEES